MKLKNIFIAVYSFPEGYPPTLNAIDSLSIHFEHIYILSRNIFREKWTYPVNVDVVNSGTLIDIRVSEQKGIIWKVASFVVYTLNMAKILISNRPDIVLLYDPIPFLAYRIASCFLAKKPIVWYHNHDVLDPAQLPKFNISKLAWWNEQRSFSKIDWFSLPAQERRIYFPLKTFKGAYFFLPNLPSLSFYNKFYHKKVAIQGDLRLIYQGHIGEGHGLEAIIQYILPHEIEGKKPILILKGIVSDHYKLRLTQLAAQFQVTNRIEYHGFGPYQELPRLTSTCHIGIGIHTGNDIMNKTLGTASNKIYEYIALGLPVLFFDSAHFREHFENRSWAFFTTLSEASLLDIIRQIVLQFPIVSDAAHLDFENEFNYERGIQQVKTALNNLIKNK